MTFLAATGLPFRAGFLATGFLATGFLANGFFAAGFLTVGFPDFTLMPPEGFADLEDGRLERDSGLFGALLRAALVPGFFPFTLGISQPFITPEK